MYQSKKVTTTFSEREALELVGARFVNFDGDHKKMTATICYVQMPSGERLSAIEFRDLLFERIKERQLLAIPLSRKTQIRIDVSAYWGFKDDDEGNRGFMQRFEVVIEQDVHVEGDTYYKLCAKKTDGEPYTEILKDKTYEEAFIHAKKIIVAKKLAKGHVETIHVTPVVQNKPEVYHNLEGLLKS